MIERLRSVNNQHREVDSVVSRPPHTTIIFQATITPDTIALPHSGLSERETEVLLRAAEGLTNLGIARRLSISDQTVKNHLAAIFRKTKTRSTPAAIRYGFDTGILPGKGTEVYMGKPLSPREKEVIQLVARGKSGKEIAQVLKISRQTVKNRMTKVIEAMGVHDSRGAVALACRTGLV